MLPTSTGESWKELSPSSRQETPRKRKTSAVSWAMQVDVLDSVRSKHGSRQLHSRCFPENYWFAKSSLDQAPEICVSCESYVKATETDLAALGDVKKGVETMLQDRLTQYREHWVAKGREPPSKDEWYGIADGEAGDSADEWLEVPTDEDGGAVPAWYTESFLATQQWYNESILTAQELKKVQEQGRQHKDEQEAEARLESSEGMDVTEGSQLKSAPLSSAASLKDE
jgi:hypothetical protein